MRSNNVSPNLDDELSEAEQRHYFIRKVYCILFFQLVVTLGIISIFVLYEDLQDFVHENKYVLYISIGVSVVVLIILSCVPDVRRKPPANYIFLGLFTVLEGITLGMVSTFSEPIAVLSAVGITAAVCFALSLFALQTKIDFTVMRGFLLVVLIVFALFGVLMLFFHSHIMKLIYSSIGVIIFSLYMLYDTQLMLAGEHEYSIDLDEHVFAALNLYLDIVQIFASILSLFDSK